MTSPLVTWLMPVRNGMPYLPLTLKSIAEQTYKNHRIIVWDNGSTDGTVEELRRWIPSRIPGMIVSERPMRLGPSLAAMVEMAGTPLCARIDADDINLPERLQSQVQFMQAHPEVGVLGAQVATSVPSSRILPAVGGSKPAIMRSVVVFPQPLGPSREKNSPGWISSEMSSTAVTSSNRLVSDCSCT